MVIENCNSFNYLILAMSPEIRQIDVIKEFQNCINEFAGMCGCEGEAKTIKRNECELKYQDIILNNMSEIKQALLDFDNEFTFNTTYPEQKLLAFISKTN